MCWFCKVILVWVFKVDPNRNKTRGRDVPQETDVTVSCEMIKKKKKKKTYSFEKWSISCHVSKQGCNSNQ